MSRNQNILVIGAGLAGPSMCYWLQRFGFNPALIEISDSLRTGGFAIDIRGIAIDVAQKMGIYNQVVENRTQLKSGRYVDAAGNTLFAEQGEAFGFRQGDDVEILRGDLVEILMHNIDSIPCHYSQSVKTLIQDNDKVTVTFTDGRIETYDLVIATDGLHSSTREQVFNQNEFELFTLGAYLCVFNTSNFLQLDHSEILFESNQKLVHINSDRDPTQARAGFMFRSDHQLQNINDEQEQKDFIRQTFRNLGWETNKLLKAMECSDDFYFDSIAQVKMNAWTKGRVALVGDAGYCASPLSGQGTSLALVGAYILAGELNKAQGDHQLAFKKYEVLLRPFVEQTQDFAAWVSRTFLIDEDLSKEMAEKRTQGILEKMKIVANAIKLPVY